MKWESYKPFEPLRQTEINCGNKQSKGTSYGSLDERKVVWKNQVPKSRDKSRQTEILCDL